MVKVRKKQKTNDICEMSLLIEKDEQIVEWDNEDLVKSIMDEVEIAEGTAREIAEKTKNKLKELCGTMNWETIDTSFIREFTNNEIINLGKKYRKKAKKYNLIGLSPYEIKELIEGDSSGENSNLLQSPESVNFNIAEIILKKYALQEMFSENVRQAHIDGKIHIHDLGSAICRCYCSGNSLEYIKLHGLKLPTVHSTSTPANNADVIVNHLLTFLASLQTQLAGAIGLDAVNVFISPYLVGMTEKQINQVAQKLIFGLSQLSSAKAGQTIFSDLNVNIGIPDHYKETKIVGPKGKYCMVEKSFDGIKLIESEKNKASGYKELEAYSNKFLVECMNILITGDSRGLPFTFPKFLVHFDKNSFNKEYDEVVEKVCECASVNGSPYFLYDRGDSVKVGQCCRLSLTLSEDEVERATKSPENSRFQALQNVTINMPNIAYSTEGKDVSEKKENYIKELKNRMDIALEAHQIKKKQIKKIMKNKNGLLKLLADGMDGRGYADSENFTYLIGITGLNEVVQILTEKQLHESDEAYYLGMNIIAEMSIYADKLSEENNMKIVLEESPAESFHGSEKITVIDKNNNICFIRIDDLVRRGKNGEKFQTYCFDNKGSCVKREIIDYIEHGKRDVYEIQTEKSIVRATKDHSFFTINENLDIKELSSSDAKIGSFFISPRIINTKEDFSDINIAEKIDLDNAERLYLSFKTDGLFNSYYNENIDMLYKNAAEKYVGSKMVVDRCKKTKLIPVNCIKNTQINFKDTMLSCSSGRKLNCIISKTYKLGYLLGQYAAEGSRCGTLWCGTDYNEAKKISSYLMDVFGFCAKIIKTDKTKNAKATKDMYSIACGKSLFKFYFGAIFNNLQETSKTKTIPTFIYTAPKNTRLGFIHGYLEGDGNVFYNKNKKERGIRYDTASQDLCNGLNFLLKTIGVSSNVKKKRIFKNEKWNDIYTTKIGGRRNVKLLEYSLPEIEVNKGGSKIPSILFEKIRKNIKLFKTSLKKECVSGNLSHTIYEIITDTSNRPYILEESFLSGLEQLKRLPCENKMLSYIDNIIHVYEKFDFHFIKNISFFENTNVYDISVEETENFLLSNGSVYAHNSASQRLAAVDMRSFEKAKEVVKGDLESKNIYYTNSVHFANEAGMGYLERLIKQGNFHPLIKAGAITHVFVGENIPPKESIKNLVKKVYEKTQTTQFTISPEYTICEECDSLMMGLVDKCKKCKSEKVSQFTRVVGYFSKVQNWSKNKKEELKHRERNHSIEF